METGGHTGASSWRGENLRRGRVRLEAVALRIGETIAPGVPWTETLLNPAQPDAPADLPLAPQVGQLARLASHGRRSASLATLTGPRSPSLAARCFLRSAGARCALLGPLFIRKPGAQSVSRTLFNPSIQHRLVMACSRVHAGELGRPSSFQACRDAPALKSSAVCTRHRSARWDAWRKRGIPASKSACESAEDAEKVMPTASTSS